ncbi:hypothetical protein DPMN_182345 [Dreissena polymorpha]|uniref:VWFA domain-containing protein n=1 Tax=Dreissena polymorpha TaxID=45954 RepID=A0A9D4I4I2_DREPO|nr:hypothetical protein DPMN_182345 [Dreissena polymorpha]
MNFGSDYVYVYDDLADQYEYISDEEYEEGMVVSDSDSDDERKTRAPPAPVTHRSLDMVMPISSLGSIQSDCSVTPPPPPPPAPCERDMAEPILPPLPTASGKMLRAVKPGRWKSNLAACYANDVYENDPSLKARKVRKGDTNIVTVKFDKLISPSGMHAGDPQPCSSCGAILSNISKLETQEGDGNEVWTCEFCSTRNIVDIVPEEIPAQADVTFMLEPALSTMTSGPTGQDESLVVFCVDVSGSMCVTTEVPGHIELRGAESLRRARLMNHERGDQYLPRQNRNVTYISRLQAVQAAIDHQLHEMNRAFPNRRVGLVTFSNEVTVYGDGKADPVSIVGDKLTKSETLREIADQQPFPDSIKNSCQQLNKKLFELEEGGPTALGPALLVATAMAGKVRGSKVILCTDGMANIGMGKLDNWKSEAEQNETIQFYDDVSQMALDKGVAISMADVTGGQVNIVDPLRLTEEFTNILANRIIATNVTATIILHKHLFFFYEDTEESRIEKKIGNVTVESEVSFEYGIRAPPKEPEKTEDASQEPVAMETKPEEPTEGADPFNEIPEITVDPPVPSVSLETPVPEPSSSEPGAAGTGEDGSRVPDREVLPFQLQIRYTDTEGAKALRVITQVKPVTRDRQKAERLAKLDVLAEHTARTTAAMAKEGRYTLSRERALMNQRVAWRNANITKEDDPSTKKNYKQFFGKIQSMENYLASKQSLERRTHGRTHSDEEDAVDSWEEVPGGVVATREPQKKSRSFFSRLRKKRSETTEDTGAALLYRGSNAKAFLNEGD